MKNKFIFISAVIVVALAIMSYTLLGGSKFLNAIEFQEKTTDANAQVVDIRNSEDYSQGHIPNAVNIDYNSKFFLESFSDLNKDLPLYIYCKTGVRTAEAAPLLESAGFGEVYYLKGGINAWKEAGLEIVSLEKIRVFNDSENEGNRKPIIKESDFTVLIKR